MPPGTDLKERCIISSSPVSYETNGDSPSPYCQCIMDGFDKPHDELIFFDIDLTTPTELNTSYPGIISGGVDASWAVTADFNPDQLNPYLQSVTNIYNTKLNEDSEILASYIRCKEESYKPIINQFRDNASIITNFVSENQGSISRILANGKIDDIIDKTDDILSAVPTSDIKDTIHRINGVLDNDNIDSIIDKTDDILSAVPASDIKDTIDKVNDLFSDRGNIALLIILILVSIFILSLISIGIIAFISKFISKS